MTVSNAPATDANRLVVGYKPFVKVEDSVLIAVYPTKGGCLSSGFGPRNGRNHSGVDFHADPGVSVHAGGSGTVREAGYRDDFGNYVIIDHGSNVFTRYAHLANIESEIEEGAGVSHGDLLGLMGNTASYRIPIHLHYELLVGDYETQKKSFGLTPKDLFSYPFVDG